MQEYTGWTQKHSLISSSYKIKTYWNMIIHYYYFFCDAAIQRGSWPYSWGFLDHTQRRTTVGRTPLDEWSTRRRDLYLTTHNTHNRQTFMPLVGFEPTIPAGERPQTYVLNRAVTGTCLYSIIHYANIGLQIQKLKKFYTKFMQL
jgi:hypothetical protein